MAKGEGISRVTKDRLKSLSNFFDKQASKKSSGSRRRITQTERQKQGWKQRKAAGY